MCTEEKLLFSEYNFSSSNIEYNDTSSLDDTVLNTLHLTAAKIMTGKASVWIKAVFFYKQGRISDNKDEYCTEILWGELCTTLKSHMYAEHSFCTKGL